MAGDAARVNGTLISWASLKYRINGTPYTGITALDYADGRERQYAWGIGRHHAPRALTAGKYTPEPHVLTCWASTAKAIRADLAALADDQTSYGNAIVPIIIQLIEPTDAIVTIELLDCRLTKNETSNEEGPEGLNEKLTFMPLRVVRDGLTLFDSSEGGV